MCAGGDAHDERGQANADLYERIYASGAALEAVDTAAAAAELNGATDVAAAAESLKTVIQQRKEFLAVELSAGNTAEG